MDGLDTDSSLAASLSQLEQFVHLSPLVGGYGLISLSPIRSRQDWRLNDRICRTALRLVENEELIAVKGDEFFVGSVDFMVRRSPDGRPGFVVLETNGGSNRGYTSLTTHNLTQVLSGYEEMLRFVDDSTPLIVMGHPKNDPLLIEKLFVAEYLKEALVNSKLCETCRITRMEGFRGLQEPNEGLIVLDSYDTLLPALVGAEDRVILNGQAVDAIIGDGVARRHIQMGEGKRFDLVLANWPFPVTDDKYLTYRAVDMAAEVLEPLEVYPIQFWRADTADELISICDRERRERDLIIKPFQGSGGAGVHPVDKQTPIPVIVEESMGEFHEKFGSWRSPFPYTVCEKIDPHQATWRESTRNFDVRVYVARDGDQLLPVGGLFRIALEPDTGGNRKRALVVNLSGYGGVDTDRGLGVSEETLRITHLEETDVAKMFAAASVLLSYIAKNHLSIRH